MPLNASQPKPQAEDSRASRRESRRGTAAVESEQVIADGRDIWRLVVKTPHDSISLPERLRIRGWRSHRSRNARAHSEPSAMNRRLLFFLLAFGFASPAAYSWGPLGHRTIA